MTSKEMDVLVRAHLAPFKTKSDFARAYAPEVAAVASQGLLSTWLPGNVYGHTWRLTHNGMLTLVDNSFKFFGDEPR